MSSTATIITTTPTLFSDPPPPPPTSTNMASRPESTSTTDLSPSSSPLPHQPPTPAAYICLFHILDCHATFTNPPDWKTHVLSHFLTHPPPPTARCPLCPDSHFTSAPSISNTPTTPTTPTSAPTTTATTAWDLMLDHVDSAHYQNGQTLAGSRPDFELMRYLYRLRIISVEQFKVLQLSPAPSNPAYHSSREAVRRSVGSSDEPFWAEYSRRREERMRGASRRGPGLVGGC